MSEIKQNTYYYLFGSEAVQIYEEKGIKALVKAYENNNVMYSTFKYVEGVNKPHDILNEFVSYDNFAIITEKDFNKL